MVTLILAVLLGCIFALPNLPPARIDDKIPGFCP
jgi:hypothetical protein